MDGDWFRAVLEEYRSLRSEAVRARDAQMAVLRLSVPLLAALIGLGVTLRKENYEGGVLLGVVVPFVATITFELWIGEIRRTVRAGSVVAAIEERLATYFNGAPEGPPMGWETWLRRRPQNRRYASSPTTSQQEHDSLVLAIVIASFFLLVSVGSCVLGIIFLWGKYEAAAWVVIATTAVLHISLVIRVIFAVRGIRLRDRPPSPAEVWSIESPVSAV